MKNKVYYSHLNLIIMVLSFIFLTGCGSANSNSFSHLNDGNNNFDVIAQEVLPFNLVDGQTQLNFSNVSKEDEFVIGVYSAEYENNQTYTLSFDSTDDGNPLTALVKDDNKNQTEDFHHLLRTFENEITEEPIELNHYGFLIREPELGSQKTFKVITELQSQPDFTHVNATLVYVSDFFSVYLDNRNSNSIDEQDLIELMDRFDDVVPSQRQLFGHESDVNSDGRFTILMSQAVNELGSYSGGVITGFFNATDLYNEDTYAHSNEQEIFYTLVPDPEGEFGAVVSEKFALSNYYPGVLVHEYQHMINYNQRVLENHRDFETSYLNEALSHLAEDIYSIDSNNYMTQSGIENPSRVAGYLDATRYTCITCDPSLYVRGGIYLFIRYLYEQAEKGNLTGSTNGADFIDRLIQSDLTGVENIVKAALNSDDVNDYNQLMQNFSMAVFLSDSGYYDDNRYQFEGLKLRGLQEDNRMTYLTGPRLSQGSHDYNSMLVSSGMAFIKVSGQDLIEAQNQLIIKTSESMAGGGFIVRF